MALAMSGQDLEGSDGGPLPELQGRARQFDDAWRAVMASEELKPVRIRLSMHQLRTLIDTIIDAPYNQP